MALFGNPNVASFLLFLEAEELALKKSRNITTVVAAYTNAIDTMHSEGFIQREALANERLSEVLFLLGWHTLSKQYLDRSLQLYRDEYGAMAKYEWLLNERNVRPDPTRVEEWTVFDEIHIPPRSVGF